MDKLYVERDAVIKICEQFGVIALKKRIEELPTAKLSADTVIHAKCENVVACNNIEKLVLN